MGSENSHSPENVQPRPGFGLAGQIVALVLAIIFIFLVFLSCLYCWARCLRRSNSPDPSARRRRLGLRGDRDSARLRRLGLEKSVIESLPVFVYQSAKHDNGLECAVCLCEFEDEEEARLLPNCKHGFHVECIDMWFDSHSTCPLCRSAVIPDAPSTVAVDGGPSSGAGPDIDEEAWPSEEQRRAAGMASETQPDDVLSCRAQNLDGTGSRFGSSGLDGESSTPKGLGKIVIDDPGRADGFPSQRFCTGDAQQCYSPADRLRSLKRILSRDKKDLPQSPCGLDLEQQARRAQT